MMKIRKFKKEDAKQISILIRKTIKKFMVKNSKSYYFWYYYYSPERLTRLSRIREIYVAEEDKKIIGTSSVNRNYLLGVYVDPKQHGKDIGTKLVKKIEKVTKKKGYKKIKTFSAVGAVKFYEKLGYRIIFKAGLLIIMEKEL